MVRDNLYSRAIFVTKLTLPLVALGLLSTVFLLARSPNPEDAVTFAKVDVDTLMREQRLSSPRFAGESNDGGLVLFNRRSCQTSALEPHPP